MNVTGISNGISSTGNAETTFFSDHVQSLETWRTDKSECLPMWGKSSDYVSWTYAGKSVPYVSKVSQARGMYALTEDINLTKTFSSLANRDIS